MVRMLELPPEKLGVTHWSSRLLGREPGRAAWVSTPGQISVVGLVSDTNGVFIATSDSGGGDADLGFHLAAHCRP